MVSGIAVMAGCITPIALTGLLPLNSLLIGLYSARHMSIASLPSLSNTVIVKAGSLWVPLVIESGTTVMVLLQSKA